MSNTERNTQQLVLQGDALKILHTLPDNEFGGIVTDPPYSSGGLQSSTKPQSTAVKYTTTKKNCPFPDFYGDAKDQRAWMKWTADWLTECHRVAKDGAVICILTDWRQIPALTDALQWAETFCLAKSRQRRPWHKGPGLGLDMAGYSRMG